MSKVDLKSKEWCELVFEGRNKAYGAYDMRAKAGRRHLGALIDILIGIAALGALILAGNAAQEAIRASMEKGDEITELSELKKEEVKKEEKKIEAPKEQPQEQKQEVKVKSTLSFTVPKIVDQVDESKKMKTQDEVTNSKVDIGVIDFKGNGGTVDVADLRPDQTVGDGNGAPPPPPASSAVQEEEAKVYNVVEQMPTFPGGDAALQKYVAQHIKYPQSALDQEVSGQVVLKFVVKEDGTVGEVNVLKSLQKDCDAEAIRVVKSLPRFIPGKQQGKAVQVWFTFPIRFTIQ